MKHLKVFYLNWHLLILMLTFYVSNYVTCQQIPCTQGCACPRPNENNCLNTTVCPNDVDVSATVLKLTGSSCGNTIDRTHLQKLTSLVTLEIRRSPYQVLGDRAFADLPLTSLVIQGTAITTLQAGSLSNLNHLNKLDLSNNLIDVISDNVFQDMAALTHLLLVGNRITSLSDNVFHGLSNLAILDLTNNSISHLSSDCFRPLVKLVSLKLSYNNIQQLPDRFLTGVPMKTLFIDHNRLTYIGPEAFTNSQLGAFNLEYNQLTDFPTEALRKIVSISVISLGYNAITQLTRGDVANFSIRMLELNSNPLKVVEDGAFTGSTITNLIMNDTPLTTLPDSMSTMLTSSTTLSLRGVTGWSCDCDAIWLASFLASSTKSTGPVCDTGKNLTASLADLEATCTTTTSTTTPSTTTTTETPSTAATSPSTAIITTRPTTSTTTSTTSFTSTSPTTSSDTTRDVPLDSSTNTATIALPRISPLIETPSTTTSSDYSSAATTFTTPTTSPTEATHTTSTASNTATSSTTTPTITTPLSTTTFAPSPTTSMTPSASTIGLATTGTASVRRDFHLLLKYIRSEQYEIVIN
ncbi:cell wall protein DAN4-like [Pomacea canaliculata]|uniref:cell wall protein DAN4-like n=1 Tax=Pomacea canaliculata TaxID=400727 RepID=UPI000D73CDB2|nr:cell wall protein DAN4-like [Pomacea canaliculata]